jgi:hypothetical protein
VNATDENVSSLLLRHAKLTFQLRPGDTIPECQAPIAPTCAECPLDRMEGDGVDSENVLRTRCGGGTGHGICADVISMAFKGIVFPI